jgi:branched-chain amino acid transport system ATP-binding protein
MLEVEHLRAWHGAAVVVRGVSFSVAPGRTTAIVGSNGAGKTTLARALAGLHRGREGRVLLDGRDLSRGTATSVARGGLRLVPQGRRLFPSLTVSEHFALATRGASADAITAAELLEIFPNLERRAKVRAKLLSGGEQQMLAIARAVLPGPRVIVLDEPTEGLAPAIVDLVATLVTTLRDRGVAVLLLEQPGPFPARVADEVLHIDRGVIRAPEPVAAAS